MCRAYVALSCNRRFCRKLLVCLGQQLSIHDHLRLEHAKMREVCNQPRISKLCRPSHRSVHNRCQPDRRSTLALRLQANTKVVNTENPAAVRNPVFTPQPAHDLNAFLHALCALVERHVEGLELGVAIAHTDAENITTAR